MSEVVIKAESLSKLYRLGTIGTGSFRQDVQMWFNNTILRKEDPFFSGSDSSAELSGTSLWALRDVSFEVKQGEAFGVIGNNGSGKSTLLKIISRIVKPTSGVVRGKGKISSLLEVGTGFHEELTGRENIFNSGYTLGMSKSEIKSRFDEIVDFSGIERFIDTPVKRYSSGMYVRLAFAVAAHLEPEILIVDEVLAVGDSEFQAKCMGKMQEVSGKKGRTILFVSHNMHAITSLCTKALWLEKGRVKSIEAPNTLVNSYLSTIEQAEKNLNWDLPANAPGNDLARLKSITVTADGMDNDSVITVKNPVSINVELWNYVSDGELEVNFRLLTLHGDCIFDLRSPACKAVKGLITFRSIIPGSLLNNTTYVISLALYQNKNDTVCEFFNCTSFKVEEDAEEQRGFGARVGVIRPKIQMSLKQHGV